MADREAYVFEFLTYAEELEAWYLIRVGHDRQLLPEESEGCERVLEALAAAEVLGKINVESDWQE